MNKPGTQKIETERLILRRFVAVIDYLFDVADMNRVCATHDSNNPKSDRAMQKAGMKYEGTLRQAGLNMQGVYDSVCYSLIRSDRSPDK